MNFLGGVKGFGVDQGDKYESLLTTSFVFNVFTNRCCSSLRHGARAKFKGIGVVRSAASLGEKLLICTGALGM